MGEAEEEEVGMEEGEVEAGMVVVVVEEDEEGEVAVVTGGEVAEATMGRVEERRGKRADHRADDGSLTVSDHTQFARLRIRTTYRPFAQTGALIYQKRHGSYSCAREVCF